MKLRSKILKSVIFIVLFTFQTAMAKTACGDLKELNEIKNLALCQSQPGLAACIFTGSALAFGYLGAIDKKNADKAVVRIWEELDGLMKKAINAERAAVAEKLAERAYRGVAGSLSDRIPNAESYRRLLEMNSDPHQDPRAFQKDPAKAIRRANMFKKLLESGAKPPTYWPVYRDIGGEFVDVVNTPFDKLPTVVREGYIKQVTPVVDQVFDHGMAGKPLTPAFINQVQQDIHTRYFLDRSFTATSDLQKDVLQPNLASSKVTDPFCRNCAKEAAAAFEEVVQEANAKKMKIGNVLASRAAMRLGMAGAMGLAGASLLTGGALTVLGFLSDVQPLNGCGGEYEYQAYINRDGTPCADVYEIDARVAKFLELPEKEQLRLLSQNPDLCDYYRRFLKEMRGEHKIISATGGDKSCVFRTESRGRTRVHTVVTNDQGEIQNVIVQMGDSAFDPRGFYGVENGELYAKRVENMGPQDENHMIGDLKLYLPAALGCCAKPSIPALTKTCSGQETLTSTGDSGPGASSTY